MANTLRISRRRNDHLTQHVYQNLCQIEKKQLSLLRTNPMIAIIKDVCAGRHHDFIGSFRPHTTKLRWFAPCIRRQVPRLIDWSKWIVMVPKHENSRGQAEARVEDSRRAVPKQIGTVSPFLCALHFCFRSTNAALTRN